MATPSATALESTDFYLGLAREWRERVQRWRGDEHFLNVAVLGMTRCLVAASEYAKKAGVLLDLENIVVQEERAS